MVRTARCGSSAAPFVLSVLVLGPAAAYLFQGRRTQAIAYVAPAFLAALVLAGLGVLIVLLPGMGGCR